jgi:glycosyltransferase involved in cell wall biosynthesis
MGQILYVASYLGSLSGAGRAGVDILIAILLTNNPVTVVSNTGKRCRLPTQIDGRLVPPPRWVTPPRPFPKRLDWGFPRQSAGWLVNLAQDPFWSRRLRQQSPPDLTIANGASPALLDQITRINPNLDNKMAMIMHGSPKEATFRAVGLNVDWALRVMEEYDYLVFVSSRCQQEWLSFPSLSSKASFYIPNCCQESVVASLMTQDRIQIRRRLRLPLDRFLAVCVASVQHRKGQDLLLEYFPDFLQAVPDLLMCLIGPIHSNWAQSLRRQINASRFGEQLQVLGTKSNAMDYIYAADLLILPSRAEAMPLTILEAMALRTPVIASDVDGIPELIEDGQSGLLFSQARPTGLVEAFAQMAINIDLRRTFAERAHQRYWSNFSRMLQIERYRKALGVMLD